MLGDGSKGISLRSPIVLVVTAVISLSAVATISSTTKVHGLVSRNLRADFNSIPKRIGLYGDSLAGQASPYFSQHIEHVLGKLPAISTLDGTAPCDALPNLLAAAKSRMLGVAVIDFSGNSLTPCMSGAPSGSPSYFARYRYDIRLATKALVRSGTEVVLAGAPETLRQYLEGGTNWEWLNQMLESVAKTDPAHVEFVNAGESVMSHGQFTWSLRCLPNEPCLNQPSRGYNFVRSPDGAHFCPFAQPATRGFVGPCSEYMSGAFRYGTAMAAAALQMLPHR